MQKKSHKPKTCGMCPARIQDSETGACSEKWKTEPHWIACKAGRQLMS